MLIKSEFFFQLAQIHTPRVNAQQDEQLKFCELTQNIIQRFKYKHISNFEIVLHRLSLQGLHKSNNEFVISEIVKFEFQLKLDFL